MVKNLIALLLIIPTMCLASWELDFDDDFYLATRSIVQSWVAYHDLGALSGSESTGNITIHQVGATELSTNPLDTSTKNLIKYSDGTATEVFFSIAGATGMDSRNGVTAPPNSGTPAYDLFVTQATGLVLTNGLIYKSGGTFTLTFSNLNTSARYDIALFGNRTTSSDGAETFTLGGASSAVNNSSTGIVSTFVTQQDTRPNAVGNVVRWGVIDAGSDGIVTITVTPGAIAYLNAVRVERISPFSYWTPADTPAGVRTVSWLSALDTDTITATSGVVTAWADKSSSGLNYTATIGNATTGGTVNGQPALNFAGDQMDTASNPFGSEISNAFVMCAYKVGAVANGTLFSISGSITPRWQAHAPWGSGNVIFDCGGINLITNRITVPYGVTTGTVVITSFYGSVTEDKREIYKNGVLFTNASPCVPSTLSTNIVSIGGSGGQYQNATIGEYIVVDGVVDEALRQKFEGYLFPRWGVILPDGHPYKNSPPTK